MRVQDGTRWLVLDEKLDHGDESLTTDCRAVHLKSARGPIYTPRFLQSKSIESQTPPALDDDSSVPLSSKDQPRPITLKL